MEWIILMAFVCGVCSLAAYWWGYQTRPMRAAPLRSHQQIVLGVDAFCRLIRGWEWVDIDEDGQTVGMMLRGVGGTTGMRLALLQVENELERGDLLPIREDRVAGLLRHDPLPSAATLNVHVRANFESTRIPVTPPRHDPTQPEPGAFDD